VTGVEWSSLHTYSADARHDMTWRGMMAWEEVCSCVARVCVRGCGVILHVGFVPLIALMVPQVPQVVRLVVSAVVHPRIYWACVHVFRAG
jgi:hypothetical protein